jgi:hypothetical protein
MRSSRRSLSRASSIGFGTLFLTLSYACTERALAPTATEDANEFAVSGILTSSLWQANGSQLAYAGSVSTQARITQDKGGVHQQLEQTSAATAPPPASTQRFGTSMLTVPSTNKLALPEGAQISWRTKFKSRRENFTTRDGKHVSLQRVADPRGGGRPPLATMLYDGDRPVSLIEAQYQKDGKRWKPTRSRITLFGKDGKPSAVTENDLAALQTASIALPGTAAALADGFRRVGGSLSELIRPDALYAASTGDDDGRCMREAILLAAAATAQVAADIGLAIAIAACPTTVIACPAVLAAMATVAATAAVYLVRVYEYDQCMYPPGTSSARPGSGGGESDDGGGCSEIQWEISYDGGNTWQYYDTQQSCGPGRVM